MPEKTSYLHGQFSWVDYMAHDLKSAEDFYSKLFGWKANPMDTQGGPPYHQFELDGKGVCGIGQMPDEMKATGMPPIWNSYVNVDNIEEITKKAIELGGQVTMPVMKVFEAGWLAYIQDPTGGNLGLWQKGFHYGSQIVNDPNSFCWNELATRDIEKAKDYYGKLFGWDYELNPGTPSTYYLIKLNGEMNGGIMQMTEEWGDMPPAWAVYFSVKNIDASLSKVEELGGKVVVPKFDTQVGPISVVSDPQGGHFYLIQINAN